MKLTSSAGRRLWEYGQPVGIDQLAGRKTDERSEDRC